MREEAESWCMNFLVCEDQVMQICTLLVQDTCDSGTFSNRKGVYLDPRNKFLPPLSQNLMSRSLQYQANLVNYKMWGKH